MEIRDYTISKSNGIEVKTNFKSLNEEQDWLFKRYYYLQILYDDKYKKTRKWNLKEARILKIRINLMRVRVNQIKVFNFESHYQNKKAEFFKKYGEEKIKEIEYDAKRLIKRKKGRE